MLVRCTVSDSTLLNRNGDGGDFWSVEPNCCELDLQYNTVLLQNFDLVSLFDNLFEILLAVAFSIICLSSDEFLMITLPLVVVSSAIFLEDSVGDTIVEGPVEEITE